MKWDEPAFLIITDDDALLATLGGKLKEWGAEVLHLDLGRASAVFDKTIVVALIDVRRQTAAIWQYFTSVRPEIPFAETVLINRSGNISASMEGMRAGASDELIVPFDTATLRQKIDAAYGRSRRRQKKQAGRSLFAVFGEAMSAAAFAQAGEFEMALALLNGSKDGHVKDSLGAPDASSNQETSADEKEST